MRQVYIVSKRNYRVAYSATPYCTENIVKVLDDYRKTINYIRELIKDDHEMIDEPKRYMKACTKIDPNPDNFEEGIYIRSFVFEDDKYYEEISYKFKSYDVE